MRVTGQSPAWITTEDTRMR